MSSLSEKSMLVCHLQMVYAGLVTSIGQCSCHVGSSKLVFTNFFDQRDRCHVPKDPTCFKSDIDAPEHAKKKFWILNRSGATADLFWICCILRGSSLATNKSKILRSTPRRITAISRCCSRLVSGRSSNLGSTYTVQKPLDSIIVFLQIVGQLTKLIDDVFASSLAGPAAEGFDLLKDCIHHVAVGVEQCWK